LAKGVPDDRSRTVMPVIGALEVFVTDPLTVTGLPGLT
jgi:hypothetical protein